MRTPPPGSCTIRAPSSMRPRTFELIRFDWPWDHIDGERDGATAGARRDIRVRRVATGCVSWFSHTRALRRRGSSPPRAPPPSFLSARRLVVVGRGANATRGERRVEQQRGHALHYCDNSRRGLAGVEVFHEPARVRHVRGHGAGGAHRGDGREARREAREEDRDEHDHDDHELGRLGVERNREEVGPARHVERREPAQREVLREYIMSRRYHDHRAVWWRWWSAHHLRFTTRNKTKQASKQASKQPSKQASNHRQQTSKQAGRQAIKQASPQPPFQLGSSIFGPVAFSRSPNHGVSQICSLWCWGSHSQKAFKCIAGSTAQAFGNAPLPWGRCWKNGPKGR